MSGEDGQGRPSGSWRRRRSRTTSSANGVDERGVFTQYYGTKALDASLLLAPLVRFLPAGRPADPGHRAGHRRRADRARAGAALQGRGDRRRVRRRGGQFTICSFWLVSALCEIGEYHRARKLCAKLLSFAGPLELYGEEIDAHTGQHLGNFPQAFTHLALINAVLHVIRLEGKQHNGRVNAEELGDGVEPETGDPDGRSPMTPLGGAAPARVARGLTCAATLS